MNNEKFADQIIKIIYKHWESDTLEDDIKDLIKLQLNQAQLKVLTDLKKEWITESIARRGEIMTDSDVFRLFVEPRINQLEEEK